MSNNQYKLEAFAKKLPRQVPIIGRSRIDRNRSCPCGSEKKFKRCCGQAKAVKASLYKDLKAVYEEVDKNYGGPTFYRKEE